MFPCCGCCRWSTAIFAMMGLSLVSLGVAWVPSGEVGTPAPSGGAGLPVVLDLARGGKLDWPMFGGTPARNLVNTVAKNLPSEWEIEEGEEKHLKWKVDLGNRSYGGPVVANDKVYVGTNNARPRDPKIKGPRGVLMCFNEADGKFLWQATHDMPPDKIVDQALEDGLCSTPAIDGDRIYYLAPACQLVCADAATGKEIWKLDMMKELKVYPCFLASGSPLVVGDLVFSITSNGTDAATGKLMAPDAPSFVAVNKKDGTLKWQSNLPGKNIIEGQWGSPAYAEIKGQPQVIFPGGDCCLYSFEPETGKLLWKFYCGSKKEADTAKKLDKLSNYLVATPVIHDSKLYIGVGLYPEHHSGVRIGHFWCVDLVRAMENAGKNQKQDVSPAPDNFDPKAPANKNSALAWHYGGELKPKPAFGRSAVFGRTISTAAVHDGLVYISEEAGFLHCLDAATGKKYWEHDLLTGVWGSPYWADDKVYMGTEDGEMLVFVHGKDKKLLAENIMDRPIQGAPVAANNTLYVLDQMRLYAISSKK